MKKVDKLFKNATVLTVDEKFNQYYPGAVAVSGDSIVAVGSQEDICKEYESSEIMDCHGKILMPGLINGHTHVPMTLLRGLSDDLRLDVWLMGYIMPVEREFVSPEFVTLGTKLACAEMIRCGTTTFADMYYFEEEIAKATADAGMRAICAESVLKFPAPDAQFYEEALTRTRSFIEEWKNHPLIVPAIAPHAPYTCTPEILQACSSIAREFDVPLMIHIAETAWEVDQLREEHGVPVVPYIKRHHLLDAKLIGAHLVHIDEGEIRDLAKYGCGGVHNPSSNLKLASGAAPVAKMIELNMNVGIGTDGPASNNDLDMFEEMRLTSFLAKLKSGDPTTLPAKTVVYMATRGGAKALHMDKITGSIEPGKRADLILVDLQPVHNAPRFMRDPDGAYAQIVYASKSNDVTHVMVNGKWLMKERQLLTVDESSLLEEAKIFAAKVDKFLSEREQSLLSKLVAIGGATQEESFEVQTKVKVDDINPILEKINLPEIVIEQKKHYKQFDTYFKFNNTDEMIRYREDELLDDKGNVKSVRPRLTMIGDNKSGVHPESKVLLSRSRYIAQAGNSLRFYREYFRPDSMFEIQKDRLRFHVQFKGIKFFINVDTMVQPEIGKFVEIKSKTWSKIDAEQKTRLIASLLAFLGLETQSAIHQDYHELKN
ncbi:MAG: amidohydrolase family protein [Candidatus Riflebacteria bacterium]|nr:amidohydrolase family protein [Candidatus Riflebacteria bacterium]